MLNYDVPIFNPFLSSDNESYFPGNESAYDLLQIAFAYEDISVLFQMMAKVKDKHQKKLLLKYAVMEWLSLDKYLCSLVKSVIRGGTEYNPSPSEFEQVNSAYKLYKQARSGQFKELKRIRNKLVAHRDPIGLYELSKLWQDFTPQSLLIVLKPIPELFLILKKLNIYTWTLQQNVEGRDLFAFIQPFNFPSL